MRTIFLTGGSRGIGHAIEVLTNYHVPHGLAVVVGIIIVNELSARHHFLSQLMKEKLNQRCFELLSPQFIKLIKNICIDKLADLLKKDKKTESDLINFVILKSLGNMIILKLPLNKKLIDEIQSIIQEVF